MLVYEYAAKHPIGRRAFGKTERGWLARAQSLHRAGMSSETGGSKGCALVSTENHTRPQLPQPVTWLAPRQSVVHTLYGFSAVHKDVPSVLVLSELPLGQRGESDERLRVRAKLLRVKPLRIDKRCYLALAVRASSRDCRSLFWLYSSSVTCRIRGQECLLARERPRLGQNMNS